MTLSSYLGCPSLSSVYAMDFAFRRQSNDELFVLGPPEKIADVMGLLHCPQEGELS